MKRMRRCLLRAHARARFIKTHGWSEYREMCRQTPRSRRRYVGKGEALADFWDVRPGAVIQIYAAYYRERQKITFTSWPIKPDFEKKRPVNTWNADVKIKRPNINTQEEDTISLLCLELMGGRRSPAKFLFV